MLYGDILVPHLSGLLLCLGKSPAQALAHILLAALYLHTALQKFFRLENKTCGIYIHLIHQPDDQTVFFIQ